jgi:hypothetical protein
MKTITRLGAVLSFVFFFFPGAWLALRADPGREAGVVILGMFFMGIGCFAGPMLWVTGERCASKPE